MFLPYLGWDSTNLAHITRLTGQRYDDAYAIWQRFHKLPESYAITYSVLCLAQQHEISVEQALTCYLEHLRMNQH
ncbi:MULTISPECIES: hypothetical protein [Spirosoma]|uniref:Uncharacterized protein n=1 Tax=Spirosoma liriopis TaxID=2937440 RepID=A0ABT0HPE0_9BACT|nr:MULTISPECIES: hypothetical protein [Spirosoma]MCK8494043.1 hypothetical protein [Spirosoma liriopis]UHG89059.1 hypothetical protein LQ777_12470 [Spirosoma oryzicola]